MLPSLIICRHLQCVYFAVLFLLLLFLLFVFHRKSSNSTVVTVPSLLTSPSPSLSLFPHSPATAAPLAGHGPEASQGQQFRAGHPSVQLSDRKWICGVRGVRLRYAGDRQQRPAPGCLPVRAAGGGGGRGGQGPGETVALLYLSF